MGGPHLNKKDRQAMIDEDLTGTKDNYIDTHSTGWCSDLSHLSDNEHTPEFPDPQGPNPIELIDRIERSRCASQDEFDRRYMLWGNRVGKQLKF